MRPKSDIENTIETYGDTVWRVCVLYFRQHVDAQDAFQETLIRYALATTEFREEEHRKAWLIRVATNICKDMLKAAHRKNIPLDDEVVSGAASVKHELSEDGDCDPGEALEAIRSLTDPPRTPVYLALYEGYTAPEIAKILDAPVGTVYSWISRGRQQLKEVLG